MKILKESNLKNKRLKYYKGMCRCGLILSCNEMEILSNKTIYCPEPKCRNYINVYSTKTFNKMYLTKHDK